MADPARAGEMDAILARFGEVQEEYEHLGGYALESQAREVLHGPGLRRRADRRRRRRAVGRVEDARGDGARAARPPDVLLMDEPTNHLDIESILWLENFLQVAAGRAADDLARPRLHEPHRHQDRRDRRRRDHRPTPATTISTSASARSARPTARRPTPGSRRCWPRSSASSTASPRTRPRPRRSRAGSRRSRRSRRSSRPRSAASSSSTSASRRARARRSRCSRTSSKAYGRRVVHDGFNLTIRRGERWCVMGRNGAGKTTLLQMIAGALAAGSRQRAPSARA